MSSSCYLAVFLSIIAIASACRWTVEMCASGNDAQCVAHLRWECPCPGNETCVEIANRTQSKSLEFCDPKCRERPQWGSWGPWEELPCQRRRKRVCLATSNTTGTCEFGFGPTQGMAKPCTHLAPDKGGISTLSLMLYCIPPITILLALASSYVVKVIRVHRIKRRTRKHRLHSLALHISHHMLESQYSSCPPTWSAGVGRSRLSSLCSFDFRSLEMLSEKKTRSIPSVQVTDVDGNKVITHF